MRNHWKWEAWRNSSKLENVTCVGHRGTGNGWPKIPGVHWLWGRHACHDLFVGISCSTVALFGAGANPVLGDSGRPPGLRRIGREGLAFSDQQSMVATAFCRWWEWRAIQASPGLQVFNPWVRHWCGACSLWLNAWAAPASVHGSKHDYSVSCIWFIHGPRIKEEASISYCFTRFDSFPAEFGSTWWLKWSRFFAINGKTGYWCFVDLKGTMYNGGKNTTAQRNPRLAW